MKTKPHKIPPADSLPSDSAARFGVCETDHVGLSRHAGARHAGPLSAAPGPASLWTAPAALCEDPLSNIGMDGAIRESAQINN